MSGSTDNSELKPATVPPRYAGFGVRLVAQIIDAVILFLIALAVTALWLMFVELFRGLSGAVLVLTLLVAAAGVGWLYAALFDSSARMGTPGKIACGIKVTDLNGQRISFGRATVRYIFKSGIALIGYIHGALGCLVFLYILADAFMIFESANKQSIHDIVAGTLVVYREGPAAPGESTIPPAKPE